MIWIAALCILSVQIIWTDVTKRRIRNHDLIILVVLGFSINTFGYSPFYGSTLALIGAGCLSFTVLLPFYIKGWMGAADVKLAAALGIWLGVELLLPVWILSILMSLVYAKLTQWNLLKHWLLPADIGEVVNLSNRKFVPYGAMLCVSAILVGAYRII